MSDRSESEGHHMELSQTEANLLEGCLTQSLDYARRGAFSGEDAESIETVLVELLDRHQRMRAASSAPYTFEIEAEAEVTVLALVVEFVSSGIDSGYGTDEGTEHADVLNEIRDEVEEASVSETPFEGFNVEWGAC